MSGYRVIAPLVVAKDQTGRNHHVYAGGWLPWLDDEQRAHFLAHGLVEEVDTPATVASPGSEQPEPDEPKKPPRVAPRRRGLNMASPKTTTAVHWKHCPNKNSSTF
ncbi:hypothetical protein [Mycobacterium botniense]|uniref:Uncharacterized protein n=1 Tax=Mycobacterium botniense TaxID=84962 RepID=A0A7I9XTU0_9MYCO|nr:hypothetical protein [Mycobacterium botniense]GFG72697.1 hypothetical protein MBOT_00620 [Mycobacterium botniense]GFG74699.1 hypothetical protein MBOT_20640 [Mycobacterium botniense]